MRCPAVGLDAVGRSGGKRRMVELRFPDGLTLAAGGALTGRRAPTTHQRHLISGYCRQQRTALWVHLAAGRDRWQANESSFVGFSVSYKSSSVPGSEHRNKATNARPNSETWAPLNRRRRSRRSPTPPRPHPRSRTALRRLLTCKFHALFCHCLEGLQIDSRVGFAVEASSGHVSGGIPPTRAAILRSPLKQAHVSRTARGLAPGPRRTRTELGPHLFRVISSSMLA